MNNTILDNSILISIVIPVYKAEAYLKECVESILMQTYSNFELILINDGSPDKSGELCNELAISDHRIKVFHRKNRGAASARNYALDRIEGEYVMFVDSDDYCSINILQTLLSLCLKYNCDIASCEFSGKCQKNNLDGSIKTFSSNEILKALFSREYEPGPHCKLVHKKVIEGIRFPKGVGNEDIVFWFQVFQNIKRLVHIKNAYYYYRPDNPNSVTKSYKVGVVDCVQNAYLMQDKIQKRNLGIDAEFTAYLHAVNINSAYSITYHHLQNEYADMYESTKNYCKRNFIKILLDKVLHFRFKIKCVLVLCKL